VQVKDHGNVVYITMPHGRYKAWIIPVMLLIDNCYKHNNAI
jgi:hypothetical protein